MVPSRFVTRRAAWLGCLLAALLASDARLLTQTADRRAPLVLVAIDGFRPDYLETADVPVLRTLAETGVRATGLIPPFPSKTFPSFTTIATGLLPVHHGIVANTMDDPGIGSRFSLSDHDARSDPRWWLGEPIWNTAARQGRRTASLFWPGDDVEIGGRRPGAWQRYDDDYPNGARVDRLLEWLSRPPAERPDFLATYFSLVDSAAHDYGPASREAMAAVAQVDALVGRLVAGLARLELDRRVNLVFVSDHGLAETRPERVILLEDYLDLADVDVIETGPMLRLAPRGTRTAEALVAALAGKHPHLAVYRGAAVPSRYRYRGSARIPPVVGVADDGWLVLTRAERDRWMAKGGGTHGDHGFVPDTPAMHGLFLANGPAFRQGLRVRAFESVHLYELFCRLLDIVPAGNDGAARVTSPMLR